MGVYSADVQTPYPFWTINLMGGKGGQVNIHRLYVKRKLADGLRGVRMEKDFSLPANLANRRHVLHNSDLVVGRHDGDQDRITGKGVLQFTQVDQAIGADRQIGNAEPFGLQAN